MGNEQENHKSFRPFEKELGLAWAEVFEDLYNAAKDTAEFHHGQPTGRSRSASIRRLKVAVDNCDRLARIADART